MSPTELALEEYMKERDRLNRIFESNRITPAVYHARLERLKTELKEEDQPIPLPTLISDVELEAKAVLGAAVTASMSRDYREQLGGLKYALEEGIKQYKGLLQDVDKLLQFEAPHILLELEAPEDKHPCLNCPVTIQQLNPDEHCHGCTNEYMQQTLVLPDNRGYNDGSEASADDYSFDDE